MGRRGSHSVWNVCEVGACSSRKGSWSALLWVRQSMVLRRNREAARSKSPRSTLTWTNSWNIIEQTRPLTIATTASQVLWLSWDLRPRHIYFPQFSIGAVHPSPTAAAAAQPGGAGTASTFPDRSHHLTTLRPRAPWQHFQALEVLDSECRFVPIPSSLASPDANRHHWQDQHFLSSLWNGRL